MPQPSRRQSGSSQTAGATMSIAQAKANFSSVITTVQQKHGVVTILRRGVPVAQIVPLPDVPIPKLRGSMAGTAREIGDIVSPLGVEWTVREE